MLADDYFVPKQSMVCEEIVQNMGELSRRHVENHGEEIMPRLYFLARELDRVDKQSN